MSDELDVADVALKLAEEALRHLRAVLEHEDCALYCEGEENTLHDRHGQVVYRGPGMLIEADPVALNAARDFLIAANATNKTGWRKREPQLRVVANPDMYRSEFEVVLSNGPRCEAVNDYGEQCDLEAGHPPGHRAARLGL